jgi:hypothetical protein
VSGGEGQHLGFGWLLLIGSVTSLYARGNADAMLLPLAQRLASQLAHHAPETLSPHSNRTRLAMCKSLLVVARFCFFLSFPSSFICSVLPSPVLELLFHSHPCHMTSPRSTRSRALTTLTHPTSSPSSYEIEALFDGPTPTLTPSASCMADTSPHNNPPHMATLNPPPAGNPQASAPNPTPPPAAPPPAL